MNIKQEKEHNWIISISWPLGVEIRKVTGTESMVKSYLLHLIIEDHVNRMSEWKSGPVRLDDIVVTSSGVLYGVNHFIDYNKYYQALIDEIEPIILDQEYRNLPQSYKDYIERNDCLYNDVILSVSYGEKMDFYDDVAALGEDDADNDVREEGETDESFGLFLISAYRSGNSNVIYEEMPDGKVIALWRIE